MLLNCCNAGKRGSNWSNVTNACRRVTEIWPVFTVMELLQQS